ncbi:Hypothetical_protein [Hexamita inflata]|uniref:Hypothetical_protein n=1 Tax=Hexamita inflata TaxID=28002 RepID=A0AA86QCI4_9EUKA|nr:Hypothetical protein HINF_LOCUS41307 [Hexamita inflata]
MDSFAAQVLHKYHDLTNMEFQRAIDIMFDTDTPEPRNHAHICPLCQKHITDPNHAVFCNSGAGNQQQITQINQVNCQLELDQAKIAFSLKMILNTDQTINKSARNRIQLQSAKINLQQLNLQNISLFLLYRRFQVIKQYNRVLIYRLNNSHQHQSVRFSIIQFILQL